MTPMDAAGDDDRQFDPDAGDERNAGDGAVAVETELLVYDPGRPDAWSHDDWVWSVTI